MIVLQSESELLTISEAAQWASDFLHKNVTNSNINYLIQYGRINKFVCDNETLVNINELQKYYEDNVLPKEEQCKKVLGDNINWHLSFADVKESDRTKHVHRIHPYKGKFIPQLVEYFLDEHVDEFKKTTFFHKGDVVIDPFSGSGTTLIEANELGIHSIGIDISQFNAIITKVKFANVDLSALRKHINHIMLMLQESEYVSAIEKFEKELDEVLKRFNDMYFPSPEFKKVFRDGEVSKEYILDKEEQAKQQFNILVINSGIDDVMRYNGLIDNGRFIDKWLLPSVNYEVVQMANYIMDVADDDVRMALQVILSRAVRSARATTHMDLDRLKEPQLLPYYCFKHFKICVPPFSIVSYFKRYANDTVKRLADYQKIKTIAYQDVLVGDSAHIDVLEQLKQPQLKQLLKDKKAQGIFTSPPYLGQLDYHEQHAYAYELFGIPRLDDLEIGAAFKGTNIKAQQEYINGISAVLINMKRYLADNAHIFIVANDKYNLYHQIAQMSGLKIVEEFKRPVLNRTARDKMPYSETIFHMCTK